MSKEFYDVMENIKKIADEIKFLEGSHPEVEQKYYDKAYDAWAELDLIRQDIKKDLKKKAKQKVGGTKWQNEMK
jgi:predicted  nucleic acid-binding Zn-ribbon protein